MLLGVGVASHAVVFRRRNTTPLKTTAWEARVGATNSDRSKQHKKDTKETLRLHLKHFTSIQEPMQTFIYTTMSSVSDEKSVLLSKPL